MSTATNYRNNTLIVHALLEKHPDGLTVPQMGQITGIRATNINAVCRRSPLIYLDRWDVATRENGAASQWVAVYCMLVKPESPPRPEMRPTDYLKAIRQAEAAGAR